MTHPTENSLDVVAGLLLERQRYEGWLSSLEGKKASTPPHVFERVRADYEARLRSVVDQLVSRAADLEGAVASLRARVVELKRQGDSRRDERNEAELRATVGEYSPEEWQTLSAVADEEIARLDETRSEVTGELERLEHILDMAAGRRASAAATASRSGADQGATSSAASKTARPPGGDGTGEGFDELAFLQSVIAPSSAEGAASPPAAAAPPAAAHPAPAEPERAVPPRSVTPPAAVPAVPEPAAPEPVAPEPVPASTRGAAEETKVSRESGGVPAFLRDVPQENVKTLQCAECHAMNYPTEWYCERCGAELAAM